ncbi:hypothetical protein H112_07773 [Trichophyton rubrum D6]|uniref:Uncharacterized protein n=4 Tax=Trichophyton TaxID=5550 RepID=F2SFF2_TRIRC|nr:uncharacterized protein TERG_00366 [Trichophyton rubrum CBS 118892]EZF11055.1 hypothetical protein H100_07798 [Trichophyton rubrum MR850]EZF37928.1 hypothetical protein H102_07761 [Trichophyton rubrum CBS 100081]EZF48564.1 hypothetical protein H103_07786 [Trichophyton rubrum CBS 288.86]EZF59205.1 hypothetical protein H104_07734 [Trichophyton rubrum CBS 289.86]EZF69793.1 hypothetical protein H105_07787 [Trichophyton soudanense CBS 452.61]EZF80593.1 hypothetical protein H110_07783 [Trichophy
MAPGKARASKKVKVADKTKPSREGRSPPAKSTWLTVAQTVGCLMSFVGNHEDKGEDVDYWRVRLGWAGDEELRDVYHRYEAVGDPTQAEVNEQVPPLRFVWVFETGEWVDKAAMLRERAQKAQREEEERKAACMAANTEAKTGRGGHRRARTQPVAPDADPDAGRQAAEGTSAGAGEVEDGASHGSPLEPEVKKRGRKPAAAKSATK